MMPGRLSYEREVGIGRSREVVFDFCSDLRNELAWNPDARSVEKLTPGPVGVGTRFRAQWARTRPTLVEIVRFVPPWSWASRSTAMGMDVLAIGMVEDRPYGSLYRVRLELRPHGLSRLLAPLAIRMMERQEARNMAGIQAAIEAAEDDEPPATVRQLGAGGR